MPANPKVRGTDASNSFTRAEIAAACELFAIIRRGGDTRIVARSPEVAALYAKFHRMNRSVQEGRSGIGSTSTPQSASEGG